MVLLQAGVAHLLLLCAAVKLCTSRTAFFNGSDMAVVCGHDATLTRLLQPFPLLPPCCYRQAVLRLKAERRWAVTGTPVQNRVRDLLSVMMFLRLEPLQDRTWWQRCMERPLKQREERGLKRLQVLMGCIALRRTKLTKVNGQPLVSLPDKRVMQVR